MPHEELTPRSDSISTESSSSPPEPPGSNHSETSSGVHSNASSDRHHMPPIPDSNQSSEANQMARRATSVADLVQPREDQWKSCSLQRNVQPPTVIMANQYPNQPFYNYQHHTKNHSIGTYNVNSSNHTNHTNGQPIYGYSTKNAQNLTNNGVNVSSPNSNSSQPSYGVNTNGPQALYGYISSTQQPSVIQAPFSYSAPQNSSQNLYGYTGSNSNTPQTFISNPQTVANGSNPNIAQPMYGYAGSNNKIAQQTNNFVASSPQNVPNGSNSNVPQPLYGYSGSNNITTNQNGSFGTNSPQNVPNGSNSNIAQPLYGYSGSNNKAPNQNPLVPNSPQHVPNTVQPVYGPNPSGSQPGYGYSGSNPQPVAQPTYGYTTQSGSNQQLYGYTQENPGNQPIYGFTSNSGSLSGSTFSIKEAGGIPVILENTESTVVIRRKNTKSVVCENSQTPVIKEEPFGRSTNMRMTSFTEHNDLKNIQASSATLPHYPTQPINAQNPNQYSTMPLPLQQKTNNSQSVNLGAGTSCNVFQRQHTTIPTHHNGVRLFPANQNPYVKRFQQNGGARVSSEGIYGQTKGPNEGFYSS